ncbi:choice-of-anchor A family protein [Bacillus cytotoxicus]|uniref:Choice-of-anchor A family protein n=1 Tax=Bacillus cytotoxicus TaxID=580165 RepID=A0AAX2CDN4_9BACI|nr:choice-of-anchor A family protein [Bacillus cytotoxicus]QTR87007.1 choice-of-anchor A family protein [Bacillus cytotoxicus]SCL85614.1 Uncharacterized protein BCB44BAC_00788 [Bacillus cytotoxicus]
MLKSLNKKMKKISLSFIILLLVCMNFLVQLPNQVEAAQTELKGLGDISYYNAVIFGDHSATSADIEGAMAVQGNMNASSYTVTAAATGAFNLAGAKWNDEGYPSLLLGREFNKAGEGKVIIQDGTVVMTKEGDPTGSLTSSYDRISYKEKSEIDAKFKEFRKKVDGVIEKASQFHTNTSKDNMSFGIGEDVNNPNIYVSSGLAGKSTLNISSVFLPNVNNKDFIVIYSDAKEVNFANGAIFYDTNDIGTATDMINTSQVYDPNSHFTELASKVVWVFPNATKISTKGYGIVGSVFAPNAVVETKGGSINGQAYLGGLHQRDGFEVHNFQLNWFKWKNNITKKGHLKIKKVDASNNNIVLEDATFEVVNKKNEVVSKITTDGNGIAETDLPFGEYILKETKAPKGYKLSDREWKVTLQNDKEVEVENEKELGKPGEETEEPGKPGEETEKPSEPREGTEKPGTIEEDKGDLNKELGTAEESTENLSNNIEKENVTTNQKDVTVQSKEHKSSNYDQTLPTTGHTSNYLPYIGAVLMLVGLRLRFLNKQD